MRNFLMLTCLSLAALTVACSSEDAAAPQAQGSQDSTSLSVDTEDGGFSYEQSDGGGNTSINVGDGDSNDGK